MRYTVNANKPFGLGIGYVGENNVTEVAFDFSSWAEEYGEGSPVLRMKRSLDDEAYPVVLDIEEGNLAVWTITNTDLYYKGVGEAQLQFVVDEVVKKSTIFKVTVERSLETTEEAPEPYEDWMDDLIRLTGESETNAYNASVSAENAATSESNASTSEANASTYASQAEGYKNSAQGYANNASASATSAGSYASQALGYANDASNSATEASGYATSASGYASSASTSANNAQGYANNASGYATSAEGYASDAQGYADDASGYANDARTSAESILDKVGDLTDLDTTINTDVVSAINEIVGEIGDVESLLSAI